MAGRARAPRVVVSIAGSIDGGVRRPGAPARPRARRRGRRGQPLGPRRPRRRRLRHPRALPGGRGGLRGAPRPAARHAGARQAAHRRLPGGRDRADRRRGGRRRRRHRQRAARRPARRAPGRAERPRDPAAGAALRRRRARRAARRARDRLRRASPPPRTPARSWPPAPVRSRSAPRCCTTPRPPTASSTELEELAKEPPHDRPVRGPPARRPRRRAGRSARASTPTPPCCATGGSTTTSPASSGSRWPRRRRSRPACSVVKPQSAFYERFGSRGVAVLERVDRDRPRGRGPGAAGRQARRHRQHDPGVRRRLPRPRLAAGGGRDHRQPLPRLRLARPDGRHRPPARRRRVRARADLQQGGARGAARRAADGGTVAGRVLDHLRALNAGDEPLGSFGAVVGATIGGAHDVDLAINGPLLAPGYGAQGGTVADLRRIFGRASRHVLPSTSRDLLRHGPDAGRAAPTPRGAPTTTAAACEAPSRGSLVGCSCSRAAGRAAARTSRSATARRSRTTRRSSASSWPAAARPPSSRGSRRSRSWPRRRPPTSQDEWALRDRPGEALGDALDGRRRRPGDVRRRAAAGRPGRRRRRPRSPRPPATWAPRRPSARWPTSSSRPSTCARRRSGDLCTRDCRRRRRF